MSVVTGAVLPQQNRVTGLEIFQRDVDKGPYSFRNTYSTIFNDHEIAVHNGKPIMKAGDMWSDYNRTKNGDVLLFQNTIISVDVKPVTLTRKRARE